MDVGVHQDGLVHVSQLADNFVKDPAEVVKPGQKVSVTVTEIDLARNRIALSMRSKPEIGPKADRMSGGPGASRPNSGPRHQSSAPRSAPPPSRPAQSLGGDWFSAALNKKK